MVCMWVACHEHAPKKAKKKKHETDEDDEDNSDSYKQGVECWIRGESRNHGNDENHGNPCAKHGLPPKKV